MQIEAGKYYRTRDGRKVGPVERYGYYGQFHWEGSEDSFFANGINASGEYPEDDLIAEWTDEPETPHFTQMLTEMQGLAESYGYTIDGVATCDDTLAIDLILTN